MVQNDLSLLRSFFKAVSEEPKEIRVSIQESLSMMMSAFKDTIKDPQKCGMMHDLLYENIQMVCFTHT